MSRIPIFRFMDLEAQHAFWVKADTADRAKNSAAAYAEFIGLRSLLPSEREAPTND